MIQLSRIAEYKIITISIILLISFSCFSQSRKEKSFYAGINVYTSTNKITGGINVMYINKKSIYFYLNGNMGLTG